MAKTYYGLNSIDEMSSADVSELHKKHLNSGYVKMMELIDYGRVFQKAEGCILVDKEGREYLDLIGGYGSLNLGHNPPEVLESIHNLIGKPNIVHNSLNPFAAILASNISDLTNNKLTRSFFCNSGSEAVEAALKLARAATGKKKFIYCSDAFHGKSIGALSVSGRENYKEFFKPLLDHCIEIPFGNIAALEKELMNDDIAAFIVEPIQGEGGVNTPPVGYLQQVRELCTNYQTLLILDEVQTGMGRTGRMFAFEHDEVTPDILCLAKSLGGGIMPIGAYVTTEEIHQLAYGNIENSLLHSATFGGNSYACASAIATIETLQKGNLAEEAGEKGEYLTIGLNRLAENFPHIKEVRGKGLLIGMEFHPKKVGNKSQKFPTRLLQIIEASTALNITLHLLNNYGILVGYSPSNPDLIRIEPPLTISYKQIDRFLCSLERTLGAWNNG